MKIKKIMVGGFEMYDVINTKTGLKATRTFLNKAAARRYIKMK
tara:strand:- start:657 stop:785 length:129 start_codon:yes stop_codon:yes gene_type:complete